MTLLYQFFRISLFFVAAVSDATAGTAPQRNSIWSWKGADIPPPRTSDGPYTPSACGNGGGPSATYAFSCPSHAMYSDDMILAAKYDDNSQFVYAVAGSASDSQCGECMQVQPLYGERAWRDDFPQLVVQIVNSGFDVMQGQFDLFIGGGGFGYFTSLNADCATRYCNGGPCRQAMYDGDFDAWTHSPFPAPNPCYGGGVRLLNETTPEEVWKRCKALSGGHSQELKDRILWDTCVRANLELFHQNFLSSRYLRVKCPRALYMLTGLRREDDDDPAKAFPFPNVSNQFTNECRGSREQGHYCLTSMSDGCVVSCAWPGKVNTDPQYKRVDRCARDGMPMVA